MDNHCPRCGYKAATSQLLRKHISRKNVCEATKLNVSIEELRDRFLSKVFDHTCSKCERQFTTKHGLTKHEKVCKTQKNTLNLNDRLEQLEKEIEKVPVLEEELKQLRNIVATHHLTPHIPQQNNIIGTNNTTINNITNQNIVIINPLGAEDTSYITQEFMLECVKKKVEGLAQFLTKKHFDPEHPENHNIKPNGDFYEVLDIPLFSQCRKTIIEKKPYNDNLWIKLKTIHALENHILNRVETAFKSFFSSYPTGSIPEQFIDEFIRDIVHPMDWSMDLEKEDDIDNDDPEQAKERIYNHIRDTINKEYQKLQAVKV